MIGDADIPGSLADIYSLIPSMNCRGRCQEACANIDAGPLERQALADAGVQIPRNTLRLLAGQLDGRGPASCPALGIYGQCTVYHIRPGVCRLWGAVESMRCLYGCQPERGFLSEGRGLAILKMLDAFQRDEPVSLERAYADTGFVDDPQVHPHWMSWRRAVNNPYPPEIRAEAQRRFAAAAQRYRRSRAHFR